MEFTIYAHVAILPSMLKEIVQVPGTLGKSYTGKKKEFSMLMFHYEFNTVVCCGWRVDIMWIKSHEAMLV